MRRKRMIWLLAGAVMLASQGLAFASEEEGAAFEEYISEEALVDELEIGLEENSAYELEADWEVEYEDELEADVEVEYEDDLELDLESASEVETEESSEEIILEDCVGIEEPGESEGREELALLEDAAAAADIRVSVTDYGANGTDRADDSEAFLTAFKLARGTDAPVYITIPKGTYYLKERIPIFSNTHVEATGATMICNAEDKAMLYVSHTNADGSICIGSGCTHGGHSQIKNISINGGTWDRNSSVNGNTGVFILWHGENITLNGATFKHSTNHMVNVAGSKNVKVTYCVFEGAVDYKGTDSAFWLTYARYDRQRYKTIEALHLDFNTADGETTAYPNDNTAVEDVLVKNCTFSNCYSGVGTHHVNKKSRATNIVIENNTFRDMEYAGIIGTSFDGFSISGNTFESSTAKPECRFLDVRDCNVTASGNVIYNTEQAFTIQDGTNAEIYDNTIPGTEGNSIYVYNNCAVKIYRNSISDSKAAAIRMAGNSSGEITNNIINGAQTHGIAVSNGNDVVITGNQITDAQNTGIYSDTLVRAVISGNTVKNSGKFGIVLNCSTGTVKNNGVDTAESGIFVTNNSNVKVESNTISAIEKNGIAITETSTVTLNKNTVEDSKANGIYAKDSTVTITSNTLKNTTSFGIYLDNSNATAVKSNSVTTAGNGVVFANHCNVTSMDSNTITGITSNAIYVTAYSRATLTNNSITTVGDAGIRVNESSIVTANSNRIKNSKGFGFSISDLSSVTMTGNTVDTTTSDGIFGNKGAKYTATSNILKNIGNCGIRLAEGASAVISKNTIDSAANVGIYVKADNKSEVTYNKVVSGSYAIWAGGAAATKKTTVIITGNDLTTAAGNYDISMAEYCANCVVSSNLYSERGIHLASGITCTVQNNAPKCATPVITKIENVPTGVKITWNSVTSEKILYRVYRKTAGTSWAKAGDVFTTSFTDTSVASSTTYQYTVRCVTADGKTFASGYDTTGKSILYLKSITPTLSNVVTGVNISWAKIAGATGYTIYRKSGTGSYAAIKNITSGATITYTDTTAVSGTTYTYAVRAVNGTTKGSFTGVSIRYLKSITPTLANAVTGVKVSWAKVTGATGYTIYRKSGTGSYAAIKNITSGTTVTYTDTTAASGTTYTYAVRAVNGTTKGAYTGAAIQYLKSITPTLANITAGVKITWTKVTGATGYAVYRKYGTGAYTRIATISSGATVTYTDTAVKANKGTSYSYAVRAVNGSTMGSFTEKSIVRK